MKALSTLFFIGLLLTACNNTTPSSEKDKQKTTQDSTANLAEPPKEEPKIEKVEKTTTELLQGKWQHVEDKSNFLVFENNLREEISDGMKTGDEDTFVLSDHCMNPSDKNNGIPKEENKYISCTKSDLCWYIVSVDADKLELSYMGRGNTLTYTRAK